MLKASLDLPMSEASRTNHRWLDTDEREVASQGGFGLPDQHMPSQRTFRNSRVQHDPLQGAPGQCTGPLVLVQQIARSRARAPATLGKGRWNRRRSEPSASGPLCKSLQNVLCSEHGSPPFVHKAWHQRSTMRDPARKRWCTLTCNILPHVHVTT